MNELDIDIDDLFTREIEITRENARLHCGADSDLSERWDRITKEINFREVIADLHNGESRELFSCPFHGRDSRPSFKVYPQKNNAWCFGCPDNTGYYDSVRFTALKLGVSKLEAIIWLERKYNLPPLKLHPNDEDEPEEQEEEEQKIVSLRFEDLEDPYIAVVAALFAKNPSPLAVRGYIQTFFDAVPTGERDSPEEVSKLMSLARVLGQAELEAIKRARFGVNV
jgi:hypothetical protein